MGMDKLDRMYKIKNFFTTLYSQGIESGNNLTEGEFIRIYQTNKDKEFNKVSFKQNIDDIVDCAIKSYGMNTYFELPTTNGEDGTEESLVNRYFLAFDFDNKDFEEGFNYKDIMFKFKELGLYYHAIIHSGNGYHVYVIIEKTNDINMVNEVQDALCKLLQADKNGIKKTQLLRIPYTFNCKEDKPKLVKILHIFDKATIKPYSIEKLYRRFCNSKWEQSKETNQSKTTKYTVNTSNLPVCINNILVNGSNIGDRNSDLQKIVVALRIRNRSLNEIQHLAFEWNDKNEDKLSENELNYQVKYIYEKLRTTSYDCKGCSESQECWDKIESNFEYDENEETIVIAEKNAKDLKYKNKKGAKMMEGNELFIYNVLLNNKDRELNIDDIVKLITYKGKSAIGLGLLRDTLVKLEDDGYILKEKGIKKKGIKDLYKINPVRTTIDKEIKISYFCTLAVIWSIISPQELRLYTHLRYKHHLACKENKAKGNVFRINQEELAKDLNVTQQRISQMIINLIESKILDVWECKINSNGFTYYTYRLNK